MFCKLLNKSTSSTLEVSFRTTSKPLADSGNCVSCVRDEGEYVSAHYANTNSFGWKAPGVATHLEVEMLIGHHLLQQAIER